MSGPSFSKKEGFQAAQANVAEQARMLDLAGTAWHAVKYGNLEMITKLFPSQCNVYEKGPVGDNVFHVAMLLNTPSTLAIARYLVKLYGKNLINTPYQERNREDDPAGLYEGETALHIAIVNRDFDMVKFLVQNGAEARARAYGGFFKPGSPVYYGEYPLSFAACTGQKDVVSYLKRHGARVNQDRDMQGNTALHMCVYHNQIEMFDHLMEYCGATDNVRNIEGLTPLVLAASLGYSDMFQHICNKRRKVGWSYGPVTSYNLSMREIDTVQNPGEYIPSATEIIIRKGHADMLVDPLVVTVLDAKWERFAKMQYILHATAYMAFVIVQVVLVWLRADHELTDTAARAALEYVSLLLALGFFVVELVDAIHWILGSYHIRRLARAAAKYRPPICAIPGYAAEPVVQKSKPSFVRLLTAARPVSEAIEMGCQPSSHAASSSQQPAALASPGWMQQEDVEQGVAQGPVAEGIEKPTSQENWGVSECLSEARFSNSGVPTAGDGSWATGEQDFVSIGVGMSDAPAPVTSMLSMFKKPGSPTRSRSMNRQDTKTKAANLDQIMAAEASQMLNFGRSDEEDEDEDEEDGQAGAMGANRARNRGRQQGSAPSGLKRADTFGSNQGAEALMPEEERSWLAHTFSPYMRALVDGVYGYMRDFSREPLCGLLALHQLSSIIHFVTWQACSRSTCSSQSAKEFDDIIVAVMALSGWLALLVHSRGHRWLGKSVILVEACLQHVLRFISLFLPLNIGFTAAFYALFHTPQGANPALPTAFPNIGGGMIALVRFMYGEAGYQQYTPSLLGSKKAVGTALFLAYVILVLLLLLNLLTAIMVNAFAASNAAAGTRWRLRWATYVLQAEKRMPWWVQQRHRLGAMGLDAQLKMRVWSHVYEVVDNSGAPSEDTDREDQIKALGGLIEKLRAGSKK